MVFEDPLDGLEQVGTQRKGALQGGLPLTEEFGQGFVPHAVSQSSHRAGGNEENAELKSLIIC